jgi:hypothetical protein
MLDYPPSKEKTINARAVRLTVRRGVLDQFMAGKTLER